MMTSLTPHLGFSRLIDRFRPFDDMFASGATFCSEEDAVVNAVNDLMLGRKGRSRRGSGSVMAVLGCDWLVPSQKPGGMHVALGPHSRVECLDTFRPVELFHSQKEKTSPNKSALSLSPNRVN